MSALRSEKVAQMFAVSIFNFIFNYKIRIKRHTQLNDFTVHVDELSYEEDVHASDTVNTTIDF